MQIYMVGGAVRDALLGLPVKDRIENMQWQTKADAKAKDKWERKGR